MKGHSTVIALVVVSALVATGCSSPAQKAGTGGARGGTGGASGGPGGANQGTGQGSGGGGSGVAGSNGGTADCSDVWACGGGGAQGGAAGAAGGAGASVLRGDGPCDIYQAASTPCVAAYSMIRGLSKTYNGPLYQVRNGSSAMNTGSGGQTMDVRMLPDGFADTAPQDSFCAGTTCTVSRLYDQSGKGNDLKVAPRGTSNAGVFAALDDYESSATKGLLMVKGHQVYPLYTAAREGYRLTGRGAGMPLGDAPQGIYALADGTHYGKVCCWDFGNVSTDPLKYALPNTLFFGTGFWGSGAGDGPWFMGDFEDGVRAGGAGRADMQNLDNPSLPVPFAMGILKTEGKTYALRMADIQKAAALTTAYEGEAPKTWANDGGIVLGIGGDNSNNSWGTFYEGAITAGYPSADTDLAVMRNLQAAGYGK